MIKITSKSRQKEESVTLDEIDVDREGNILITKKYCFDGRYRTHKITITPVDARRLKDACHRSLEKITGHKYSTTVKIK